MVSGQVENNPRSRNAYNNVKQLTTGTGESSTQSSMKMKTIQHSQSPKLTKEGDPGEGVRESRNGRNQKFNTMEQGSSGQ